MNRTVLAVVALAVAFSAGAVVLFRTPEAPTTLDDCRFALGETNRTNCVTRVAIHMFRADPAAAIAFTEAQLPNALDRDFVYLQVTFTIDATTPKYCMKIVDKVFHAQCIDRTKRPHLGTGGEGAGGPPRMPIGGHVPAGGAPPTGAIP